MTVHIPPWLLIMGAGVVIGWILGFIHGVVKCGY